MRNSPDSAIADISEPESVERRVVTRRRDEIARSVGTPIETSAGALAFREAKARAIATFEYAYVRELLQRAQGNVSLAARLAGKERSRFNRLIRKYQLQAREFRPVTARSGG